MKNIERNSLEKQGSVLENLYQALNLPPNTSLNYINKYVFRVSAELNARSFYSIADYRQKNIVVHYKNFLETFDQTNIPVVGTQNFIHIEKFFTKARGYSFLYYLVDQRKKQLEDTKTYENMYVLESGFLVGEKNSLIYFIDKDSGQEFTGIGFNEVRRINGRIIGKINNHWYLLYMGAEKQGVKPTSKISAGYQRIDFSEKTGHLHGSNNSIGSVESGEDLEKESVKNLAA